MKEYSIVHTYTNTQVAFKRLNARLRSTRLDSSRFQPVNTMAYTYNFYKKMEDAMMKNPNADIVNACRSYARTTQCTSYTCFAISCMACCCCTKCAATCLEVADHGSKWSTALNMYSSLTPTDTRKLFLNGMKALSAIYQRLNHLLSDMTISSVQASAQGNQTSYMMEQLKAGMLRTDLSTGKWMNNLIYDLSHNIIAYNAPHATMSNSQYNITISHSEFRSLLACFGMMYPACIKNYSPTITAEEMHAIKRAIAEEFER